jgi:hypothetical protein
MDYEHNVIFCSLLVLLSPSSEVHRNALYHCLPLKSVKEQALDLHISAGKIIFVL